MRFLLLLPLLLPLSAFAGELQAIFEFPSDFNYRIYKGVNDTKQRLIEALFDKAHDFKVAELSGEHTSMQLRIGRAVYNNQDVFNSYTVVDTINIPFNLYSWGTPIGGSPNFSFSVGVGGGVALRNFRQVSKNGLKDLLSVKEQAETITGTDWYRTNNDAANAGGTPGTPENNPPFKEIPKNQTDNPLFDLSSINHARFAKFWNIVAFPAKLPFRAEWLKRMEPGEIITYSGSGYVELGPSFGWSKEFRGFLEDQTQVLNASAWWRYMLSGGFRVAVLKEDERFVKLKFTRTIAWGQRAGIGASSNRVMLYDGFAIAGSKLGEFGVQVMPFNVSWTKVGGPELEIGYRFDLSNPEAAEAYDAAALGRLAKADELFIKYQGQPDAPVRRLFIKEGKETSERWQRDQKIVIYQKSKSAETRTTDADLTLESKEKQRIYSAVAENRLEQKVTFGSREKFVTKATVDFKGEDRGIVFEGWTEDSITDGVELNQYQNVVEMVLARGTIFPRIPAYGPPSVPDRGYNGDDGMQLPTQQAVNTGATNFYYRMDFDENVLAGFLRTKEDQRWEVLEDVFGVGRGSWSSRFQRIMLKAMQGLGVTVNLLLYPFDLRLRAIESLWVADRIETQWDNISKESEPKDLAFKLGSFFTDSDYGPERLAVFSQSTKEQKAPYFLTASNYSMGRVVLQEGAFSDVGKTIEEYRRAANIDNPEVGTNVNLHVNSLSAEVIDQDRIRLRINVEGSPKFMYFRITRTGLTESNEKELVVLNMNQVGGAEVREIILDRTDGNTYRAALARAFLERGFYNVYFAVGNAGRDWGPVTKQSVFFPWKVEPAPAPVAAGSGGAPYVKNAPATAPVAHGNYWSFEAP